MLYVTRALLLPPGLLGLILACAAIGAITGALLTSRIAQGIGVGRTLLLGTILFPAPLLLVPLASGSRADVVVLLMLSELGSGFGLMLLDISFGSIFAAVIPDAVRARVMGAFAFVNYGIRPIGALIGGALPGLIGMHATLWVAAIGGMLGFLWLLPSPIPGIRDVRRSPETGPLGTSL